MHVLHASTHIINKSFFHWQDASKQTLNNDCHNRYPSLNTSIMTPAADNTFPSQSTNIALNAAPTTSKKHTQQVQVEKSSSHFFQFYLCHKFLIFSEIAEGVDCDHGMQSKRRIVESRGLHNHQKQSQKESLPWGKFFQFFHRFSCHYFCGWNCFTAFPQCCLEHSSANINKAHTASARWEKRSSPLFQWFCD